MNGRSMTLLLADVIPFTVAQIGGKVMKKAVSIGILSLLVGLLFAGCAGEADVGEQGNITFKLWGSVPFSGQILADPVNQDLFRHLRKEAKSVATLGRELGVSADTLTDRLNTLRQHDLVAYHDDDGTWLTRVPVFTVQEVLAAEQVCQTHARHEAHLLKESMDDLRRLHASLSIGPYYSWESLAWIWIGALIGDLTTLDRVRFFPEFREEKYLPKLHPDGSRWSYVGYIRFDQLAYKYRKWSFYQNHIKDATGGFSRFGYHNPPERRATPPKNPLFLAMTDKGDLLFYLNKKPMSINELVQETGLSQVELEPRIQYLKGLDPPALRIEEGKYFSEVPIIPQADFKRLLAFADEVASKIHVEVTIPCGKALARRAKELGLPYPLPDGTLVRDIALRMLVDEGLLPQPPEPPVPWNFGVWGWEGAFPLWEEVSG